MCTWELSFAVTSLANSIAKGTSQEELALLASLFVQLGDTLATIAAQRAFLEERGNGQKTAPLP